MGGRITALRTQKRDKEQVNVYLDGEYAFSLKAIVAARLRVGRSLSDEEIDALMWEDSFQKAYDQALDFLSYRPRSRAEVLRYLRRKEVPPRVSEEVIRRLTAAGLVDDVSFARYWLENRESFNPRSPRVLRYELRQKGLDSETISQVLEGLDEERSAYRAAAKRAGRWAHLDWESFRRKAGSFLKRRGFSYQVIESVLNRLWEEMSETRGLPESHEGIGE